MNRKLFLLVLVLFLLVPCVLGADLEKLVGNMFDYDDVLEEARFLFASVESADIGMFAFYWYLGLSGIKEVIWALMIPFVFGIIAYILVGWMLDISTQDFKDSYYYWLHLGVFITAYLLALIFVVPFAIVFL